MWTPGWLWLHWCCPAGLSPDLPPTCASIGPGCLGRLPTTPGCPLRTPSAGGVAAPRRPRGHAGDAGGGLATAPRRRQRGPDLPEAPDGRPRQVRGPRATWRQSGGPGRLKRGGRRRRAGGLCCGPFRAGTQWQETGEGSLPSPRVFPTRPGISAVERRSRAQPPHRPLGQGLGLASADLPQSVSVLDPQFPLSKAFIYF